MRSINPVNVVNILKSLVDSKYTEVVEDGIDDQSFAYDLLDLIQDTYKNTNTTVMCDTLDTGNSSDSESKEELTNPDDTDIPSSTSEYLMSSPIRAKAVTLTDDVVVAIHLFIYYLSLTSPF